MEWNKLLLSLRWVFFMVMFAEEQIISSSIIFPMSIVISSIVRSSASMVRKTLSGYTIMQPRRN